MHDIYFEYIKVFFCSCHNYSFMDYLPDCIDVQYMKFFSISFSQNKTTLSIKCISIPKKSLHQSFWTLYLIIVILKHLFNVMDQVHNSYMIYCSKDTLFERHQLIKTYLIFFVNHVFITSQTQKYSRQEINVYIYFHWCAFYQEYCVSILLVVTFFL